MASGQELGGPARLAGRSRFFGESTVSPEFEKAKVYQDVQELTDIRGWLCLNG